MLAEFVVNICKTCGTFYQTLNENDSQCLDCQYPKYRNRKIYNQTSTSKRYISIDVKQTVWQRDEGKCVCCGSNEQLEYDHIIPVSKGGSNSENNIQILCLNCNRTKSNKIL